MDIVGDIQTQPFINRGPDVTAGWTMNASEWQSSSKQLW